MSQNLESNFLLFSFSFSFSITMISRSSLYLYWSVQLLAIVTMVNSFSFRVADSIRIETAPLIGGPLWLPLHVKVVVDEQNVFDYVPINATSPDTIQSLLTLKAVPAEARVKRLSSGGEATVYAQRARQFCASYTKDLHLIENNCWSFAYELVQFVLSSDND